MIFFSCPFCSKKVPAIEFYLKTQIKEILTHVRVKHTKKYLNKKQKNLLQKILIKDEDDKIISTLLEYSKKNDIGFSHLNLDRDEININ